MSELMAAALEAQRKLAELRAEYARNPRENGIARDARAGKLARLERERDAAAAAASTDKYALDAMLYGSDEV